jgi:hypothetical protein
MIHNERQKNNVRKVRNVRSGFIQTNPRWLAGIRRFSGCYDVYFE